LHWLPLFAYYSLNDFIALIFKFGFYFIVEI